MVKIYFTSVSFDDDPHAQDDPMDLDDDAMSNQSHTSQLAILHSPPLNRPGKPARRQYTGIISPTIGSIPRLPILLKNHYPCQQNPLLSWTRKSHQSCTLFFPCCKNHLRLNYKLILSRYRTRQQAQSMRCPMRAPAISQDCQTKWLSTYRPTPSCTSSFHP